MMKEIQANDLQPDKVYYIETKIDYGDEVNINRRRQKGVFKKFILYTGKNITTIVGVFPNNDLDNDLDNDDFGRLHMAHFESVVNINPNDPEGRRITGSVSYPYIRVRYPSRRITLYYKPYIPIPMLYHPDNTRFYACEKDEIIERKVTNMLQQITGDPRFNFY